MLRLGPDHGPSVIVAPPLFEEANRTRAILVAVLRRLAAQGIAGAIPDLPGQGESTVPTADARLTSWRRAFAAAAATLPGAVHVVAVRGGALVDGETAAVSRWYWSPMTGTEAVRELERLRATGGGEDHAGNLLAPELLRELGPAEPMTSPPLRIVRLESDPRAADAKLPFPPPWRASEPSRNAALEAMLADDITRWIASCAG